MTTILLCCRLEQSERSSLPHDHLYSRNAFMLLTRIVTSGLRGATYTKSYSNTQKPCCFKVLPWYLLSRLFLYVVSISMVTPPKKYTTKKILDAAAAASSSSSRHRFCRKLLTTTFSLVLLASAALFGVPRSLAKERGASVGGGGSESK